MLVVDVREGVTFVYDDNEWNGEDDDVVAIENDGDEFADVVTTIRDGDEGGDDVFTIVAEAKKTLEMSNELCVVDVNDETKKFRLRLRYSV